MNAMWPQGTEFWTGVDIEHSWVRLDQAIACIAELEARLLRYEDGLGAKNHFLIRAEQAEAELAALKGKYDWMMFQMWCEMDTEFPAEVTDGDFVGFIADLERRWAARAEEGEPRLGRDERLRMGLTTAEVMRRLKHDGYNPAPRAEEGGGDG